MVKGYLYQVQFKEEEKKDIDKNWEAFQSDLNKDIVYSLAAAKEVLIKAVKWHSKEPYNKNSYEYRIVKLYVEWEVIA